MAGFVDTRAVSFRLQRAPKTRTQQAEIGRLADELIPDHSRQVNSDATAKRENAGIGPPSLIPGLGLFV